MKVGFDIRPALFSRAGIGRYTRELAAALTRLPEAPFLELYAPAWRRSSHPLHELVPTHFRLHRGILPARAIRALNRLPGLDAGRFPARVDVFHWTDFVHPPVRSCPAVLTLHDAAFAVDPTFHGPNSAVLLNRVRLAVQQAARIILVSETSRADAVRVGAAPEKLRVVPNGVNPFFQPSPQGPEAPLHFLTVGTLEPRKNHARILQALEQLWDRDAAPDWVIAGRRGWETEAFLGTLAQSRHRKRIHWLEAAPDSQLLQLYRSAWALVYPSLHEGFGLPVLEAMACGVPVVVAAGTAPAEIAGESGIQVDSKDVDSIRTALEKVLTLGEERETTSRALRERAAHFSWEESARRTLAVYQEARAPHG